jgi:replicative DNA helicase
VAAAIEQLLISKVLAEQNLNDVTTRGVRPEHFGGHYEQAWEWLTDHVQKHGTVPTERQFALAHSDITLEDASQETVSGLVEELFNQYASEALLEGTATAMQALNSNDTGEAKEVLKNALDRATASTDTLRDTNLIETWLDRYEEYKRRKNEERKMYGIHTGFPSLDELTGGFRAPNFILFVGEPKRGKSLYSLVSARAANEESNKKVLYISFEMGSEEVATRYDALNTNLTVNLLNTGNITSNELEHIRSQLKVRQGLNPFIISEDTHRTTTVGAVRAKCIEHQPDIVFVDGMYMMRGEGTRYLDERETLTQVTRGFKFLAQELDITVVGTTQVLPGKVGNKKRKIEAQSIGYTSSFIQDADLILGCELDTDVPKQSIIRIVEGRNVPKDSIVTVKWDWQHMEFTEVGMEANDDADDYADYY